MSSPKTSSRTVILAAIDESEVADDVLRTAGMLSQTYAGAELHVVHVVDTAPPPVPPRSMMVSLPRLLEEGRSLLDRATARAGDFFDGRIVGHLAAGTAWREIVHLGSSIQADLVVVGSHRKRTVERWLLGSVSEEVVRKASCAVLVARPKEHTSPVPEIEPPCPGCHAVQTASGGAQLWCARHDEARKRPKGHVHYETPAVFAVGSMLIRPEG